LVLDPATRLVSYQHAVHEATEEAPWPEPRETHLLAYRDRDGLFQALELTPGAARLLVEAAARPLEAVFAALGIQDPAPSLALLEDLARNGAIAGFRSNLGS
jgi:hypothetical protein